MGHVAGKLGILGDITSIIIQVLQYFFLPILLYQLSIFIAGSRKSAKHSVIQMCEPEKTFALIVAAHNEETVIENTIRNLKDLDYPADKFDIYVIADNCSDHTALIAARNGAIVRERCDPERVGKGYALQWFFEGLESRPETSGKYDAMCIVDADNLLDAKFLSVMNDHLLAGHKIIQGFADSKNPFDSVVSGNNAISYWINNRFYQCPRYNLGHSCTIFGTGFVVSMDIIKELGWSTTSVTEDLEFTLRMVLNDHIVYWAEDAVYYDEKPITMKQSVKQRNRWLRGQADCLVRYFGKLLRKAKKEKNFSAFDNALWVVQPFIIGAGLVGIFLNFLRIVIFDGVPHLLDFWFLFAVFWVLASTYWSVIVLFIEKRVSIKLLWPFLIFPLYNLSWIPIIIQGIVCKESKKWDPTEHTRSICISEIEKAKKAEE